jgi:hypothetical protein
MADITLTTNTYAGEELEKLIARALLSKDGIVEKGLVTPLSEIKKRKVLHKADIGVEFQDPAATFNSQSSGLTLDEEYIDPVPYEVMLQMDYSKLRTTWQSMRQRPGSMNDYDPTPDVESFAVQYITDQIGIANEQLYLLGKSGVTQATASFTAAYLGLYGRFEAGSTVKKLSTANSSGTATISGITTAANGVVTTSAAHGLQTGEVVTILGTGQGQQVGGATINGQSFQISVLTTTTFELNATTTGTASTEGTVEFIAAVNVMEALDNFYNSIPDKVRTLPDFKMVVPLHVQRAYAKAQATVANGAGSYFVGTKEMDYLGQKLTVLNHAKPNTIGGWSPSNVMLGFDLLDDENNIETVDMRQTTLDQVFRYKARMKSDINFVYGNEITYLRPA